MTLVKKVKALIEILKKKSASIVHLVLRDQVHRKISASTECPSQNIRS